jgi:hypothetical protein
VQKGLLGQGRCEVEGHRDGLLQQQACCGSPALHMQLAVLCLSIQHCWVQRSAYNTALQLSRSEATMSDV